jgi:four helix bundle protein
MNDSPHNRPKYDLEDRTFEFARRCRGLIRSLPRTITTIEDARQLARSSGSVASNYIEANEALSKKDFRMRIKISRKEAKESALWLRLLGSTPGANLSDLSALLQEAQELTSIFGAILQKTSPPT